MATLDKEKLDKEKQVRKIKVTIIFMSHIFVTIFFAYLAHQLALLFGQMAKGKLPEIRFDFNYINAWKLLLFKREFGVFLWLGIFEVAFLAIMFTLLLRPRSEISNVREYSVTDNIKIPIPVGNGQHGNAWFASKAEKEKILKTIRFDGKDPYQELKERPGVVISMERKGNVDVIKYLGTFAHSIILALTGAGKTRRVLLQTICLQIMAGNCILISDVKGEIYYYTSGYAEKRGYKVIVVDLCNPAKSSHYNFLQPVIDAIQEGRENQRQQIAEIEEKIRAADKAGNLELVASLAQEIEDIKKDYSWTGKAQDYTWDIVAVFAGEQKGEPLWYNGETATMAACIMAICMEAPQEYWNLYNVYNFIAYMAQEHPVSHKTPLSAYLNTLPDTHPAKTIFMQSQVAAERTRASFYTSALGTLRLFTNPGLAEMSAASDFSLYDVGKEKIIIYMIIPDEKKTYYPIASVLINQLYIAQVETARKNGGKLPIPTDYDLDEVGNFPPIPVLANLLAVGRSRGIVANLVIQDYQQLEAKYKEEVETIKTQCGLKIFLKSDNPKTLEEISKTLGNYTVEVTSASTSANTSTKTMDANISNSSNLAGRKLLMEDEISKFKAPDALVMVTSERPMVTKLPDLSQYHFNAMLGLGDEEHNTQLILRLETMRPERKLRQVPLWGIWNQYKEMLEEEAARQMKESNIGG